MKNVRVWFEKTGPARYISHLDLTRCMARALKLSRLPVWYTEGFNPRIYMTYAMPLSLGIEGERECMDVRFTKDVPFEEAAKRLNERLPQGVRVLGAGEPVTPFEEVIFAEYELLFETQDSMALREKFQALSDRETVTVTKRSKKGDREVDIKPYFEEMVLSCPDDAHLLVAVCLPCSQSGSVNPTLLCEALKAYEGAEPWVQITRKCLLDGNFLPIR